MCAVTRTQPEALASLRPPERAGSRRPERHALTGRGREDGTAVVESTLVIVLLVILLLAVLQVGFVLHIRNTLVACAADGARYAANADRWPEDGAARTREMITGALGAGYATDVTAGTESFDGVDTVFVEVRAEMPVIGPLGFEGALVVRGHAFEELG